MKNTIFSVESNSLVNEILYVGCDCNIATDVAIRSFWNGNRITKVKEWEGGSVISEKFAHALAWEREKEERSKQANILKLKIDIDKMLDDESDYYVSLLESGGGGLFNYFPIDVIIEPDEDGEILIYALPKAYKRIIRNPKSALMKVVKEDLYIVYSKETLKPEFIFREENK